MIGSVRQKLSDSLAGASKADKAIASYMLAQLNSLAFETAASIAGKVAVSEPTVGRFCRSIGYASFKDLKDHLKQDLGDRPWLISDRLRDLQRRTLAGEDQLARGLQLEIAGLVAVYELAHTPEWKRVIKRLATTPAVFVTGFQTERGVAQTLRQPAAISARPRPSHRSGRRQFHRASGLRQQAVLPRAVRGQALFAHGAPAGAGSARGSAYRRR